MSPNLYTIALDVPVVTACPVVPSAPEIDPSNVSLSEIELPASTPVVDRAVPSLNTPAYRLHCHLRHPSAATMRAMQKIGKATFTEAKATFTEACKATFTEARKNTQRAASEAAMARRGCRVNSQSQAWLAHISECFLGKLRLA